MDLYPRSFHRLVLLGNLLVAAPLLIAIGYAAMTVELLSQHSNAVTGQAAQAGRIGWELPEDLHHMERSLRQYQVLRDPALLDDYADARRGWRDNAVKFSANPLLAALAPRVDSMLADEESAYRRLGEKGQGLDALRETVGELSERTVQMLEEAKLALEREREMFQVRADELHRRLLMALGAGFLIALTLALLGRRLLAKLFSRFERAVLALGEGKLDRRIRLRGPDDMQRIGQRLEWLRGRLAALEEQRTLVLRHVSHELKTPLAALREGASLLSEGVAGPLTTTQAKIAGIMQNNTLRLQTLIDSLLKLQRAAQAGDRFEPVPVRLDELVQQSLGTHQLATRNKRLRLAGSLAAVSVEGGREELTAVVDNLIANAVKFSPENGAIRISLGQDEKQAVFEVVDQGPGIPAGDRQRIFEPFFRGTAGPDVAGVGLGLAIANEYIAAHRGRIELLDVPIGAHFRVTLPLAWESPR